MKGKASPAATPPAVWTEFVRHLRLHHNLRIRTPSSSRDILGERIRQTQAYTKAMKEVRLGRTAFDEVRLNDVDKHLGKALEIMLALRYHWINPSEVAAIMLMRGQAFKEAKKTVDAEFSFRRALEIDPGIRMKPGFDHPDMVSLFERVRIRLLNRRERSGLVLNVSRETRSLYALAGYSLHGRLTDQTLEIRMESPRGVLRERIQLGEDSKGDGQRLASRVHAGLPFGRNAQEAILSWLSFDLGFDGSTYLSSPVGLFPHYGVRGQMGTMLGETIFLVTDILMSISGRDFHEHLRQSITSFRLHFGGGSQARFGKFRGLITIGLQADRLSEVVVTNSAACKYFRPEDLVPRELCDFERDIDRTEPSWSVGPALSLEGRLNLFNQIDLITRVRVGAYVLHTEEHDFDWPLSGTVGLGYRLE